MAHPGLLSWANSIRLTMASDSGRQVFKDQVQTHGFLFLDDYLDNIVSGAKQDPLIELVKTPGRKKAIARKPKLMSSKLGNTVTSLSFEGINENASPANALRAPLPPAKLTEHSSHNTVTPQGPQPRPPLVSIHVSNNAPTDLEQHTSIQPLTTRDSSLLPTPVEHNDLSMIAEDEEPSERSRTSTSGPVAEAENSAPQVDVPEPPKPSPGPETHHDISIASASSAATFQSIPLESPKTIVPDDQETVQSPEAPLEIPHGSPMIAEVTGPLPSESSKESIDQIMSDVRDDVDRKSNDRPVALSFPTLPEPMPLRKSMKPSRDPSLVMQGAATPGAPIGGKRTSWLMKAREVKALETTSKKHVPSINFFSGLPNIMSQGIKRKSEDRLTVDQVDLGHEEEERATKVAKIAGDEVAPRKSKDVQIGRIQESHPSPITQPLEEAKPTSSDPVQEGVLDRLKKTVEGFGVRVSGKTFNKSLGGEAATALAEARAAAEARVAERDRKEDELTMAIGMAASKASEGESKEPQLVFGSSSGQKNTRLSISDLFPSEGRVKEKHKAPEKPFQFKPIFPNPTTASSGSRQSTSTTPPNSPPPHVNSLHLSLAPVFNKPPPVFAPPSQVTSKVITPTSTSTQSTVFNPPPRSINSIQPSTAYPDPSSPPSFKGKATGPLTAQSTLESVQSDQIFDHDDDEPAWMPQTQDTDYTSGYTQSQPLQETQICDEDDSWPVDEKLAAGVHWTFGGSKEDSMTWSTLPSQSQRGDTGPVTKTSSTGDGPFEWNGSPKRNPIPGAFDDDMDNMVEDQEDLIGRDAELEDIILEAPKTAIVDMELKTARPQSQMSMASFESSQSQQSHGGFLNQASKLLSSALGTKKKQSEVKLVLQKAAFAAKKQQEEADKKAARLKEMESRRQQALQRKAEEERARAQEEERKMKDEAERRKKEKEGNTEKRALKLPANKKDDDAQKKRKIELDKKPELKKPTPSMLFGKSHLKSSVKQASTLNSSVAFSSLAAAGSSSNLETESSKPKEHANQQPTFDEEISQPSQLVQSLMSARAKAQIEVANPAPPPIPTENIELPDINSEYSDSEDEDRVRTFDPPEWAQSPELRQALEMQSTINPDDIFGAVRPLKMEEIFKTRTSRFRARTSSANWTGADRLTKQEESAYARRMGFK